jgi:glycosyltransferase involved in cell wall biosynthesis
MHIVTLTRQISHYHRARFEAAAEHAERLTVIALTNEGKFREFVSTGPIPCAVVRLYSDRAEYLAAGGRRIRRAVAAALESALPDVVAISGWASAESFAGIEWARSRQKRVVVMSDSQASDSARRPWREYIKTRILRYCDAALVAGRAHREYIVSLGLPAERVMLGYDAVDNAHFERGAAEARLRGHEERERLGLPERYMLASARFIAKKNLPIVVSAFASACADTGAAPHLVILGDGEQRPEIEEAIRSSGMEQRIHLAGFQEYKNLPRYYGLAEGFIHIPRTEQWGLVVNEAAAAGLPLIVSHSCGCASELVIDGENGYLADAFDASDVTAAIRRLFALTAESRAAMGAKSQRIVGEWGPDRFARGLVAAAEVAQMAPYRTVSLCDALTMSLLARRPIETVS